MGNPEAGHMIRCFVIEPTDTAVRALRRYASSTCPGPMSYHDASAPFARAAIVRDPARDGRYSIPGEHEAPPHDDPRWPTQCACGYRFAASDEWQVFGERLYRRADTGEEVTLRNPPVGALWRATWLEDSPHWCGTDGQCWACQTPGGTWMIDGRASNCAMPDDWIHRCWVRHGTAPDFTIDKNGKTCAAGAGSIQCGSYHGFLRNGYLT